MSASIYIRAKHVLELSCPGCSDKCEVSVATEYGEGLLEDIQKYRERHQGCVDRLNERAAA